MSNSIQKVVLHDSATTNELHKTTDEDLGVYEPKQVVLETVEDPDQAIGQRIQTRVSRKVFTCLNTQGGLRQSLGTTQSGYLL